jgi:hypothetical protein
VELIIKFNQVPMTGELLKELANSLSGLKYLRELDLRFFECEDIGERDIRAFIILLPAVTKLRIGVPSFTRYYPKDQTKKLKSEICESSGGKFTDQNFTLYAQSFSKYRETNEY